METPSEEKRIERLRQIVAAKATVAELRSRFGDSETLLTRAETAAMLRRSVPTLERWARTGVGPPYKVVGGLALYPLGGVRKAAGLDAA